VVGECVCGWVIGWVAVYAWGLGLSHMVLSCGACGGLVHLLHTSCSRSCSSIVRQGPAVLLSKSSGLYPVPLGGDMGMYQSAEQPAPILCDS
jgi:hypothetical protein